MGRDGACQPARPPRTSVPEICDELASSRPLVHLGHQLLEAATSDIEAVVGGPVDLRA